MQAHLISQRVRKATIGIALVTVILGSVRCFSQEGAAARVWADQQGRVVRATFIGLSGTTVTLQLENGTRSEVPLATLSTPDQLYIEQLSKVKTATPGSGSSPQAPAAVPTAPVGPLTWPASVVINPKDLLITEGAQKPEERKFYYQSGSFGFISNAPLAPAVMREVSGDFELVRALFTQLPWGWQPRPEKGTHFVVYLTETDEDFIALGGNDSSGGGSKDDYIFSKFTTLGLKKVGPRYAYDARTRNEGAVVGPTTRLLLGEMRNLTYPWSDLGLEEIVRTVAYNNGGLRFSGLEGALKERIQEQAGLGVDLDSGRLISYLRMPRRDMRTDVQLIRRQNYFDGMLLVYYFGYLNRDGKGTELHEYYRAIAQEALGWRAYKDSKAQTPRPRDKSTGSYPEWALIHLEKLLAGRKDNDLRADIIAKFRSINVKFEK